MVYELCPIYRGSERKLSDLTLQNRLELNVSSRISFYKDCVRANAIKKKEYINKYSLEGHFSVSIMEVDLCPLT